MKNIVIIILGMLCFGSLALSKKQDNPYYDLMKKIEVPTAEQLEAEKIKKDKEDKKASKKKWVSEKELAEYKKINLGRGSFLNLKGFCKDKDGKEYKAGSEKYQVCMEQYQNQVHMNKMKADRGAFEEDTEDTKNNSAGFRFGSD